MNIEWKKWHMALGRAMKQVKDEAVDSITSDPIEAREMKKVAKITMVYPNGIINQWDKDKNGK